MGLAGRSQQLQLRSLPPPPPQRYLATFGDISDCENLAGSEAGGAPETSGEKPGVLLKVPQSPGQAPAQKLIPPEMSAGPRLKPWFER